MVTVHVVVRATKDFSQSTYTESPSTAPFLDPPTGPDLIHVIRVFDGQNEVFSADPARMVVSDAPGDCTNQLRVEYLEMGCTIQCNGNACGVHLVP